MSVDAYDLYELRDLTEARQLDAPALVAQLQFMTGKTHGSGQRKPMDENEKLLDEAFWYASRGEIDEALYRLSMVDDDEAADDDDEGDFE